MYVREQVVAGKDKDEETRMMIFLNVPFSPDPKPASTGLSARSWWGWLGSVGRPTRAGRSNADPAAGSGGVSGIGNGGVGVGGRTLTRMTCASSGEAGRRAGAGGAKCNLAELNVVTGAYAGGFVDLYQQGNNDMIVLHSDDEGVLRAKGPNPQKSAL